MDNLSTPWSAARIVGDGVIAYPLPLEAPLPWVAMADVAAAIDTAIASEVGGWFALPGVPTTGLEIAYALDEASGRPSCGRTITPTAFADMLRPHLGDHAADGTAAAYAMLADAPPHRPPTRHRRATRSAGRHATSPPGPTSSPGRSRGRPDRHVCNRYGSPGQARAHSGRRIGVHGERIAIVRLTERPGRKPGSFLFGLCTFARTQATASTADRCPIRPSARIHPCRGRATSQPALTPARAPYLNKEATVSMLVSHLRLKALSPFQLALLVLARWLLGSSTAVRRPDHRR